MVERKNSRTLNLLLEIIINLIFFVIVMIVCVNLFAKAYQINEEALSISRSVLEAQLIIDKVDSETEDTKIYYDLEWNKNVNGKNYIEVKKSFENDDSITFIIMAYDNSLGKMVYESQKVIRRR